MSYTHYAYEHHSILTEVHGFLGRGWEEFHEREPAINMMTGSLVGMPHEGKNNKGTNMDSNTSFLSNSYMKSGRMSCLVPTGQLRVSGLASVRCNELPVEIFMSTFLPTAKI
jgi:hypothetical protein